jgi:hypothetical protein
MPKPDAPWLSARVFGGAARNLAELALLKAFVLRHRGETGQAIDQLLRVVKYGHMLQNSRGPLIQYLVALGIKERALNACRRWLESASLPPERLVTYAEKLGRYSEDPDAVKNALRIEYQSFRQYVNRWTDVRLWEDEDVELRNRVFWGTMMCRFWFKPNETKRLAARITRSYIENVPRPYVEMQMAQPPDYKEISERLATPDNPLGEAMYRMLMPSFERFLRIYCRGQFQVRALRAMFAMKAYHAEQGRLPESLEALVPDYLDEVPRDPFDGKQLRYSREKKIIYTVGKDGKDTGGSPGEDRRESPDPTYEIPF